MSSSSQQQPSSGPRSSSSRRPRSVKPERRRAHPYRPTTSTTTTTRASTTTTSSASTTLSVICTCHLHHASVRRELSSLCQRCFPNRLFTSDVANTPLEEMVFDIFYNAPPGVPSHFRDQVIQAIRTGTARLRGLPVDLLHLFEGEVRRVVRENASNLRSIPANQFELRRSSGEFFNSLWLFGMVSYIDALSKAIALQETPAVPEHLTMSMSTRTAFRTTTTTTSTSTTTYAAPPSPRPQSLNSSYSSDDPTENDRSLGCSLEDLDELSFNFFADPNSDLDGEPL
jgi:hypothetical protein